MPGFTFNPYNTLQSVGMIIISTLQMRQLRQRETELRAPLEVVELESSQCMS